MFVFNTFDLPRKVIWLAYFVANTVFRFPLDDAGAFPPMRARVARFGSLGRTNSNQPPKDTQEDENPRMTMDWDISVVHGFEVRITHATTLQITKTRRTAVNLGAPCLRISPPPRLSAPWLQ